MNMTVTQQHIYLHSNNTHFTCIAENTLTGLNMRYSDTAINIAGFNIILNEKFSQIITDCQEHLQAI